MNIDWVTVLLVILLLDSLGAVWVTWFGQNWYLHHLGQFAKYFPPARGWALMYFLLTLLLLLTNLNLL